jgi:predicted GTPase
MTSMERSIVEGEICRCIDTVGLEDSREGDQEHVHQMAEFFKELEGGVKFLQLFSTANNRDSAKTARS